MNLKDGFKLFYIKDNKLYSVLLSDEQESVFENVSLPLLCEVQTSIKVDIGNPICELEIIRKGDEKE